jgi:potassium-transporting ATPase ATP-binding subunit
MSGVDLDGRHIRKGAFDAIKSIAGMRRHYVPPEVDEASSGFPIPAARPAGGDRTIKILGAIHLKDIIKGGMRERFDQLRAMGIRTVMITGDNPLTAAAIAREAGSMTSSPKPSPKTSWR